jgi:hypothetical protein
MASCITNDPYAIGYSSTDSSWSALTPATNYAYLIPVGASLTNGATSADVTGLGVVAATSGGYCDLYLYSDSGGAPDTRLTFILQASVSAVGPNTTSPQVNTTVTAGQTYWVGADCYAVEFYQKSISTETVYLNPQTFGDQMTSPYPVGSANVSSGIALSLYMEVQNVF